MEIFCRAEAKNLPLRRGRREDFSEPVTKARSRRRRRRQLHVCHEAVREASHEGGHEGSCETFYEAGCEAFYEAFSPPFLKTASWLLKNCTF